MGAELLPMLARGTNSNNDALSGAKWFFYETGGSTPQSVYTTSALSVAHANPVVAGSGGIFAPIYFDSSLQYRGVLKTSDEATTIFDIDPINAQVLSLLSAGAGSAEVGFTRSETGAVATTVQAKLRNTMSVKDFGVVGDGSDETTKMQSALDAIASGVRLSLSGLTVTIDDQLSITSKSNFVIDGEGGTIKAKAAMTVAGGKQLMKISGCQKFRLENFTLDGNRANRTPSEVAAHSIDIANSSEFILQGIHSINSVVDGFYFAAPDNTDTTTYCLNFMLIGCHADNCYRQGASFINAYDFQVIGGSFNNSTGTAPEAGIDVESNAGATVGNTRGSFIGVEFSGNAGVGLALSDVAGSKTFNIDNCYFSANTDGGVSIFTDQTHVRNCYFTGHTGAGVTQGVCRFAAGSAIKSGSVENCTFESNAATTGDIYVHSANSGIRVRGNRVEGSGDEGIVFNGSGNVCSGNVVLSCSGVGISAAASDSVIEGNKIDDCVGRGIYSSGSRVRIQNNLVTDITSVSGAYIQSAGSDDLIVGNICSRATSSSDYGIRIDSTALGVYSNHCINLNSTDSYNFITSADDDFAFNNIGGSGVDRRQIEHGGAIPFGTTGNRPSASAVAKGQMYFNTTTNKLNTSDGTTNWYNADGTTA